MAGEREGGEGRKHLVRPAPLLGLAPRGSDAVDEDAHDLPELLFALAGLGRDLGEELPV